MVQSRGTRGSWACQPTVSALSWSTDRDLARGRARVRLGALLGPNFFARGDFPGVLPGGVSEKPCTRDLLSDKRPRRPYRAEGEHVPKLIYQDPEIGTEVIVEITPEVPEVTIGRNPGNIIRINNPSVSRRHTKFVYEAGRCTLYDLNSSNGTYVNGMRIQSQVLEHGDLVRVGEFPLEYADEQAALNHQAESPGIASMASATAMGMGFGMDEFGQEEIELDASSLIEESIDDQPMMLGEDEIHEVLDPDELYPALEPESFGDDTVDGGAEIAASLAALRAASREGQVEVDHTQRADGHALNLQSWEREYSGSEFEQLAADTGASVASPSQVSEALNAAEERPFGGGGGGHDGEREAELQALRSEVASLRQMLDAGVADSTDMQIERMRGERDRLTEERRNLVRQLKETRQALDEAPTAQTVQALEEALGLAQEQAALAQAQVQALTRESESRAQQLEEAGEREQSLHGQIQGLHEELEAHRQSQALVDSERADLGSQVSELQSEMQSYEDRYHQALLRIDDVTEELSASLKRVEALEEAAEIAQAERDSLESELANRLHDLEVRDERIVALTASLEAEQQHGQQLSEKIAALEEELSRRPPEDEANELVARATTLDADLRAMTQARDELQAELLAVNAELATQRQLMEDLEARHGRVAAERDQLTRERDGLKQEKAAFARETDYLQVERRKMGDELLAAKARVEELEKDRKKKRKIFEELSKDLRGLVEENDRLGGELAGARQELEQAPTHEVLQGLRSELGERDALIESISLQLEELESDASNLTRDLGQIAEERDQLAERETELREELEALQAALTEGDADSGQALEALRDEVARLEQELERVGAERDAAQAERVDAESAVGLEEFEALQAELTQVQQSLASAQAQRDELQAELTELQQALEAREAASGEAQGAPANEELARLMEEKTTLETTLAEIILERDRLEDELRQLVEA
ncbi:hypothetical protein DL240_02405 [Lujinxingia litoralis]|uniref:FHA domain-containing protein n=1 Tax=Lujinxingia litoralis TaxID=2211119 RepID=A0A328CBP5_9DELT|nr:hypothetical protein DL240_02405 [Lujinxingia litoralis]